MQKTDLMEIKKTLKKDKLTISRMCACHVSIEKDISTSYCNFLNLPDAELYKYLEIIKKLMSCKAGDTLQAIPLKNAECKKALDAMKSSELKQEGITDAFLKNLSEIYEDLNNYAVFLFYSAYDIPAKGEDKLKQGESDEVYQAIYGVICPLSESEPGLSYFKDDKEFHNRIRDCLVGTPIVGFMYPDYDGRQVDDTKIVYGICSPKAPHNELPQKLFGGSAPVTAKDQAGLINETIAEVIKDKSKVAQVAGNIARKIAEVTEPEEVEEEIPESGEDIEEIAEKPKKKAPVPKDISVELIKEAVVSGGVDEEEAEQFAKKLADNTGDTIRIDKVPKKGKVKIEDVDITIPSEKIDRVSTETRAGKKYVLIELDDADSEMFVNGIKC